MKITLCENPFDLTRDRRQVEAATTLGATLEREGLDSRYVVSCNGELLPPERAMQYSPQMGDDIHLVLVLGNSTLRTIAMIGVAVAAAAFAGPLGGMLVSTFGVTAGSTAAAALTGLAAGAISAAGSLLVAGIASLFSPDQGGQSYGVLGPATTARSGIPIPKGYGTFRAAGNIVESWPDIQGDNGDEHDVDDGADRIGRQYINCRFDFGWGPAAALRNLQLNGKDLANYPDVAYVILLGTNDQQPVTADDPRWVVLNRTTTGTTTNNQPTTGFDTVNNCYPQNQRVRADVARNFVVIPGQGGDTQKLTVTVTFLRGCWRTDENGVQKRLTIYYDVYYRLAGSGEAGWQLAQHHAYTNIQTTILRQATIIDGLQPGRYDTKLVKLGSGAPNNPMEATEHESNKFGDELWIESVQETSYTTLSYPNSIQVCLRFMASGVLSGSDVNMTADIDYLPRSTMPPELADLAMDNPAVAACDILYDDVIGADLPLDRIDLDWLRAMADLSDTLVDDGDGGEAKLATFNGVFDQPNVSVWKALQAVCTLARSSPQRVGTRVTGWIDAPDIPVQLFNVGNTLLDSYEKVYLNLEDRAQEVVVSFADQADNYKTRNPVRVITAANESSEEELKKTTVNLLGCKDRVQAYYWAVLQLHHNQDAIRVHKWQSNRQAIRCRTGNVVLLQTDSPTGAWGGHVEPGSDASALLLDRADLPFDAGTSYSVVVQLPAVKRLTCVVAGVGGSVLALAGYDGHTAVNRVVLGDRDTGIQAITAGSNGQWLFTVDDPADFTTGSAVELWMTDPLVTSAVAAVTQESNEQTGHMVSRVTLAAPLPAVPEDWCSYVYQSMARQAIKVRITGIAKNLGQQRYTLTAKDYSDASYILPPPVSGQSYVPPAGDWTPIEGTAPAQASLAVQYTTSLDSNGDEQYQVTGIVVQSGGSGYTGASKAALQSDYNNIHFNALGAGSYQTDPTQTLTLERSSSGAILSVTGWSSSTQWHAPPYVVLTK